MSQLTLVSPTIPSGISKSFLSSSWSIICPGGAGNWCTKEVFPSLAELHTKGFLPNGTRFLGIARGINLPNNAGRSTDLKDYHALVHKSVAKKGSQDNPAHVDQNFLDRFFFYSANAQDQNSWYGIKDFCDEQLGTDSGPNRAFLLSTPPNIVPDILKGIKDSGFTRSGNNILIMEKPFGHNASSCEALFSQAGESFGKKIYPVDHYRTKEAVLQLSLMRREDPIFNLVYNKKIVSSVTITAYEPDDLSNRHQTYFAMRCGAGSDMFLTHLLTLALWMAQPTESLQSNADRDYVKATQLHWLKDIKITDCHWGQYDDGYFADDSGTSIQGFSKLSNNPEYKKVPTAFSCKVVFAQGPLAGVPFYIQTGKGLPEKHTEITLELKPPSVSASQASTYCRFILHKRIGNQIEDNGVVMEHVIRSSQIDLRCQKVTTAVQSRRESGTGFRPYSKLLYSAMTNHWLDFLSPEVLIELWRVVEPIFAEFEDGVARDIERPRNQRKLLHVYNFGSLPEFMQ